MQAYEFNTVVRNGIIQIPEQLSDKKLTWVKVILISDSESNYELPTGKKKFSAMKFKTKGITFNREEAHER